MAMILTCAWLLAVEPVTIPADPGLYYASPAGVVRMEGRSVTVERSRGRTPISGKLPMSGGGKVRAEILGDHAAQQAAPTPVFYFRAGRDQQAAGAADLVLVRLTSRSGHRELTVSSEGDWNSASGIPLQAQVELYTQQVASGLYKLVPAHDLAPGEYGFYLFRGRDLPGLVFDFSVAGAAGHPKARHGLLRHSR